MHHSSVETKRVLSGNDGFSKTNETIKNLMKLNGTIADLIRNKVKGTSGDDGSKGSKGDYGLKGSRGMKGIQGDRGELKTEICSSYVVQRFR